MEAPLKTKVIPNNVALMSFSGKICTKTVSFLNLSCLVFSSFQLVVFLDQGFVISGSQPGNVNGHRRSTKDALAQWFPTCLCLSPA